MFVDYDEFVYCKNVRFLNIKRQLNGTKTAIIDYFYY